MLEAGIQALGDGFQDGLLDSVDNPLAGLFAGVLATVLVQSSSVSTSTIVGLVGSGAIGVTTAVPMIMGANIGTTVTNTVAALGSARRTEEFRRAFAGATMHDFFNLIAVAIFLPLELATGFLAKLATRIAGLLGGSVEGGKTRSPIKEAVREPVSIVRDFVEGLTDSERAIGTILIIVGLGMIFIALALITANMRQLIASRIEAVLNRFVSSGGGLVGMGVGLATTVAVQSSSITTSILVPMVGSGILTVRNAFPITLGANLGTTITALLAALAVDLRAGLVIALVHTLFNLSAIVLIYPIQAIRAVPVRLAEALADRAAQNRMVVVVYTGGLFIVVPAVGIVIFR
jgi:sodium-dependent phosphate cotransporter